MPIVTRDTCRLPDHVNNADGGDLDAMVQACFFAETAGALIMNYYGNKTAFSLKADQSPVTEADLVSNDYLVEALGRVDTSIPVVSEENDTVASGTYWTVDPLDGTREFIDRTGGFCVKIALIRDLEPVVGAVFCPVQDVMYAVAKNAPPIKITRGQQALALKTKDFMSYELRTLFNAKGCPIEHYRSMRQELQKRGIPLAYRPLIKPGLPRNLRVAEGLADAYMAPGRPGQGSAYTWDIAADDLILRQAGGILVHYDGTTPDYSKPRLMLPGYIGLGDRNMRTKLCP